MKQNTTPKQTAKLVELGFEKPKSMNGEYNGWQFEPTPAYSIGELIEVLPTKLIVDDILCSRVIEENEVLYYKIATDFIGYWCDDNTDLIDNLYDMIVKLKEEGVI